MKRLIRYGKTALGGLGLAVSLALAANPLPAQAATFVVDDTPTNNGAISCPATIYTTIQAAVNAAPAGATITVCPGTYPEAVLISGAGKSGLKLMGKGLVTVEPPYDPFSGEQIDVENATNVTIRGLYVTGAGRYDPSGIGVGIYYHNSSGAIMNNVVTGIAHVPLNNIGFGNGITVKNDLAGAPLPVKIQQNSVQDYQSFGIAVEHNAFASVAKNTLHTSGSGGNNPYGIALYLTPGGQVQNNTVSHDFSTLAGGIFGPTSTGIIVWGTSGALVANNRVGESRIGLVLLADCSNGGVADGNAVRSNTVRDSDVAIVLAANSFTNGPCATQVNGNLVLSNKLYDYDSTVGQVGIYLNANWLGAVVTSNVVSNNKIYGFFGNEILDFGSGGNVIFGNKVGLLPVPGLSAGATATPPTLPVPTQPPSAP